MVKKKSKFRHISILNKKYYFYSIKFSDPTGDSGWHTVEDIKKFVPSVMVTQAYVFSKDKNFDYFKSARKGTLDSFFE